MGAGGGPLIHLGIVCEWLGGHRSFIISSSFAGGGNDHMFIFGRGSIHFLKIRGRGKRKLVYLRAGIPSFLEYSLAGTPETYLSPGGDPIHCLDYSRAESTEKKNPKGDPIIS